MTSSNVQAGRQVKNGEKKRGKKNNIKKRIIRSQP